MTTKIDVSDYDEKLIKEDLDTIVRFLQNYKSSVIAFDALALQIEQLEETVVTALKMAELLRKGDERFGLVGKLSDHIDKIQEISGSANPRAKIVFDNLKTNISLSKELQKVFDRYLKALQAEE